MSTNIEEAAQPPTPRHPDDGRGALKGKMGTAELIFTVLAVSAPLGSVAGVMPIVFASGNGAGAPATYLVISVILLMFAVGLTTMSRHFPQAGAFYSYISIGLGRPAGLGSSFIALWTYLTLMVGAYAFFGVNLNTLLDKYAPGLAVPWWVWSIACLAFVTVLGHFNVDVSGKVLSIVMTIEVIIVFLFNIPVLFKGGPEGMSMTSFTPSAFTSGSLALGLLFASSTFVGFESTAIYRREVKNPNKTIPRATYLSIILIGAFYILSSWCITVAFGPSKVAAEAAADPTSLFARGLAMYTSPVVSDVMQFFLMTSIFGSILSTHNPIARYIFSLAQDKVLPARLGKAHPVHGSPFVASLATTVIALAFSVPFVLANLDVVSFYSWMFGIGALGLLILESATCLAVIVYFARHKKQEPLWHRLIAPLLGLAGLMTIIVVVTINFGLLIGGSTELAILFQVLTYGLGVLGAVLAVRWRKSRPATYSSIGGFADAPETEPERVATES